ncbi:D-amino acid oxidase, partial [Elysia marginata]
APRILVLGAGINGLSSAVCVQQACPLAQVQLVAEHFSPDTTSDGAGGSWGPYLLGDTDPELIL